jgi:hypothetical protein
MLLMNALSQENRPDANFYRRERTRWPAPQVGCIRAAYIESLFSQSVANGRIPNEPIAASDSAHLALHCQGGGKRTAAHLIWIGQDAKKMRTYRAALIHRHSDKAV